MKITVNTDGLKFDLSNNPTAQSFWGKTYVTVPKNDIVRLQIIDRPDLGLEVVEIVTKKDEELYTTFNTIENINEVTTFADNKAVWDLLNTELYNL